MSIGAKTFEALMGPLGPFENAPELAVATSGGADSMALTLLANNWARLRGGSLTALTVDHGLRPEAADEARQVGKWLAAQEISHKILRWRGPKPKNGLQAAAREARYELLAGWCRRNGVLHLILAHHRGDQAETVLLRREMGSGMDGLSGMAPVRALPGVRLLRPLLNQDPDDLRVTLRDADQSWLEDPSNLDTRFARVRARRRLEAVPDETNNLLALAESAATERRRRSGTLAALAARSVRLHPAGFCRFDPHACIEENKTPLTPLLADILQCIGGGGHRPRRDRVARLGRQIVEDRLAGGRTLAGARILPRKGGLLICREPGRLPMPVSVASHGARNGRWDRFDWKLSGDWPKNLAVGALGERGWQQVRERARTGLPAPVRPALPALWQDDRVLAVPHLNLMLAPKTANRRRKPAFSAHFHPIRPLQPEGLVLV